MTEPTIVCLNCKIETMFSENGKIIEITKGRVDGVFRSVMGVVTCN